VGVTIARGVIGGLGVAMIIGAVAFIALGGPGTDLFVALFMFVPGVLLLSGVILERNRYRSLHAERVGDAAGPGGGERHHPDARFQRTDERFVDPTTEVRLQVWIDPATGERRYVPEA